MFELQQQGYDPQTVKALLYTQTVVTGISSKKQIGELYLLRFPSSQGKRFFQDMQLEQYYVSIPDTERLMLMYIDQYVAPPQYIPEESDGAGTAAVNGKNGHAPQDENEEK